MVLFDGARKYVYGQGLAYSADASNAVEVYHTDALGSVRALTDRSGNLTQTYATDAFGVPTQPQGSSSQAFRFTGQQQDGDGLVYLRARYYDPQSGRFLGRDTVGGTGAVPGSLNRYTYAQDNPIRYTDPNGHFIVPAVVIVVGAVVVGAAVAVGVEHLISAANASHSSDVGSQCTAKATATPSGAEVIIDTNAVPQFAKAQTLIAPGVTPVITPTIVGELNDIVANGKLKGMPGVASTLKVVSDVPNESVRAQIFDYLVKRSNGMVPDGAAADAQIGATAAATGRPIITADKKFWEALHQVGVAARLLQ